MMKDSREYTNAEGHDRLRHSAEKLMEKGATPRTSGGALSVDALTLLYQHASTPETAPDALKLLHELRTHQVELDLLYEQLQANEHEINEELTHYKSLYEFAPAAYLIVANDGVIIEGNQAAGVLFGTSVIALTGKALGAFLEPGQEEIVNRLLRNSGAGEGERDSQGTETLLTDLLDRKRLAISAKHAVTGDSILMILTEITASSDES